MATFATTLKSFCDEMRLTLPEIGSQIDRVSLTPSQFIKSWEKHLPILLGRDADALFSARDGLLLDPVQVTKTLWSELSENTHNAIWKYLRALTLEAAMESNLDTLETDTMQHVMNILTQERLEKDPSSAKELFEESMSHLKPLFDRLKEFATKAATDASDTAAPPNPFPEIPERLRNGRIAKLAEELTKQFDPKEFGIDPALLEGNNIEDVLAKLAEIFQRDPTQLMKGAKKMAEKIKRKITGGSIKREELIAEAQEFMKLFKEHPMFKETLGKVESMMGAGGLAEMFGAMSPNPGAPSERRNAVQERLRRKMAARKSAASSK